MGRIIFKLVQSFLLEPKTFILLEKKKSLQYVFIRWDQARNLLPLRQSQVKQWRETVVASWF